VGVQVLGAVALLVCILGPRALQRELPPIHQPSKLSSVSFIPRLHRTRG
jgi:hypothetical protein